MADFLRLQLEQAGSQGGAAADALAVVCQVARMPLDQLHQQLSQLLGAGRKQEPGLDGEEASSKEKEVSWGGGRCRCWGCWRCAHCCRRFCTAF